MKSMATCNQVYRNRALVRRQIASFVAVMTIMVGVIMGMLDKSDLPEDITAGRVAQVQNDMLSCQFRPSDMTEFECMHALSNNETVVYAMRGQ